MLSKTYYDLETDSMKSKKEKKMRLIDRYRFALEHIANRPMSAMACKKLAMDALGRKK